MAQGEEINPWPAEEIPDPDRLFLRVHSGLVPDGILHPNVFREQHGSMSVDWERYSTPEESRRRAIQPAQNGIIALFAEIVRSIEPLEVRHEPDWVRNNRAHSAIYGMSQNRDLVDVRKTKIRGQLYEHFHSWLIYPAAPVAD